MFEKRKVIVTLTTIPSRLKYLNETILSLVDQSANIDEIVLSLPIKSIREPCEGDPYKLKNETIEILKKYNVTIWRTKKDYGPATKLLGILERELPKNLSKEEEPLIITVDDDKCYNKECVKNLLEGWKRNQNCVVSRMGSVLIQLSTKSKLYLSRKNMYDIINRYHEIIMRGNEIGTDKEIAVVFGTGGVLYRTSYFNDSIFDYIIKDKKFPKKKIFLIDDIYISGYLSQKGIVKKVIKFDMNTLEGKMLDTNSNNRRINPLININTTQKYKEWSIDVIKYYEEFIVKKQ